MLEEAAMQGIIVGGMAWIAIALSAYFSITSRLTRLETQVSFLVEYVKRRNSEDENHEDHSL